MPVAASDRQSLGLTAALKTCDEKAVATIVLRPGSRIANAHDQFFRNGWSDFCKLRMRPEKRLDYLFIFLWFH